jgi:hypothetical protein
MSNTFRQDDSGQWWFEFGGGRRVRARLAECATCKKEFPTYRNGTFCSVTCRSRARAVTPDLKLCAGCERGFIPGEKEQRFCSHSCAATAMHANRPVTTRGVGVIKGADNPRYERDKHEQWWYVGQYRDGRTNRTRAHVLDCASCATKFLTSVFHRKQQLYCSKSCKSKEFHKAHPGAFKGENAPAWRGGKVTTPKGYVQVMAPYHPSIKGTQRRYVLEHRLVMEQALGRFLERGEYVHHKNGIRNDNRIENLELWQKHQPPGQRAHEQQHCPTCTCHLKESQ